MNETFDKWFNQSEVQIGMVGTRYEYQDAFRAGMLAAAEICKKGYEQGIGVKYQGDVFAEAIREAAKK